jgi:hypothetical protein
VSYTLYGLEIAANVALPGLPSGCRQNKIDVQILLKENSLFSDFPVIQPRDAVYVSSCSNQIGLPTLQVARLMDGQFFGFFYGDGCRFIVDKEGRRIWADWPENFTLEDACTYLKGPVIAFVQRLRGVTSLHASSVVVEGQAIALVGLPGSGKSTTAAALAISGYSALSDDVVVLADQGDRFLVQPGYPRLNLWPNSVRSLLGCDDALPRITPTWNKRYLALDHDGPRFESKPMPLGAIYILGEREADLTEAVVEDLEGHEAFAALVANTYVNYLLDRDMRALEFDVLSRLLAAVTVRRVRPVDDSSKVFELCETIIADARKVMFREPADPNQVID